MLDLIAIDAITELAIIDAAIADPANAGNLAHMQAHRSKLAGKKSVAIPAFKRAASANWFTTFQAGTIKKLIHISEPTIAQAGRGAGREVREAICLVGNKYGHTANLRVSVWTNDEGVFAIPAAGQGLTITKGGSASNGEFWVNVQRRESDETAWTEESLKQLELDARAAVALRKIAGNSAPKPAAQSDDEDLNG
jgi:hypothetical protein